MKLVLLRHGMTRANVRRLYCGSSDLPLCPEGRAALERLRDAVDYPDVRPLVKITSGMRRSDETLELLFGVRPEQRNFQFRELDFGRFELHSYEDLRDDADYQAWIGDRSGKVAPPGGESTLHFRARVFEAADALKQDALVVCHGGVIAALMERWFPQEERNLYQWQPGFGLGYIVELRERALGYAQIGPGSC